LFEKAFQHDIYREGPGSIVFFLKMKLQKEIIEFEIEINP